LLCLFSFFDTPSILLIHSTIVFRFVLFCFVLFCFALFCFVWGVNGV
jgi:hypothetical protein